MTEDLHHEILVPVPDAMVQEVVILTCSCNISITMTEGATGLFTPHASLRFPPFLRLAVIAYLTHTQSCLLYLPIPGLLER